VKRASKLWGKNVLTLNPHIHQKSQKISNYYINDQTLLRIIKLLYKRTPRRALQLHRDFMASFWRNRHSYGFKAIDVRRYGGNHVAETLLSEGVITIKTSYWCQLQAILKRTQIFQQLGMFSFQSMPYIDVANHPSAIDMTQHRRDKTEILKCIRAERNAQRRKVKSALTHDDTVERLGFNIERVIQDAGWAVREMIDGLNSHLLHVRFDTSDVGVTESWSV
jgi:hypothetical protein